MYAQLFNKEKKLAVIGLGYVGLPVALAFAKKISVIGFDINEERIALMKQGVDPSRELEPKDFENSTIVFTTDLAVLQEATFFVVTVPTPIDKDNIPDLTPVLKAAETLGKIIKNGDCVVFESTVYPGCTEDDCIPVIEKLSGLKANTDFSFGYSPERINPGDKVHTLQNVVKIVSGSDIETLELVAKVYELIVDAGVHRAPSVKVAEAAKVVENTQRDLNIALMNELSLIFGRMGINTHDVIEAASTKWNFLRFYPGLVGGHCIGVDPYYLTHKAQQLDYTPRVILSSRAINDEMATYVAKKVVQFIIKNGTNISEAKVLVMGCTFKENVSDIRNSKIADVVRELSDYNVKVDVIDPYADSQEVQHEYGFSLQSSVSENYDVVILAVNHREYSEKNEDYFKSLLKPNGLFADLKGIYRKQIHELNYWNL